MAVQARFWVQSVKKTKVSDGFAREVIMAPVIRPSNIEGGKGNVEWSKYTPSGEIRLVVTDERAGQWYEDRIGEDIAILMDDPR